MRDLVKTIKRTTYAGQPATLGTPGQTSYVEQYFCYSVSADGTIYPFGWSAVKLDGLICELKLRMVNIPGVPASPGVPQVEVVDYNYGWNASARSIEVLPSNGYVEFVVPRSTVGIVVGLAKSDATTLHNEIVAGMKFGSGSAAVIESGVVNEFGLYPPDYANDDVWQIKREGGWITYNRNGSAFYGTADPGGVMFLKANLFAGGDAVLSPVVVSESGAAMNMQPIGGLFMEGEGMSASLSPMVGQFRQFTHMSGSLAGIDGFMANGAFGRMSGSVGNIQGSATIGAAAPNYGVFQGSGFAIGGQFLANYRLRASMSGDLGAVEGFAAEGNYSFMRSAMAPLSFSGVGVEGNHFATIGASAATASAIMVGTVLTVVIDSEGQLSGMFATDILQDADLASSGTLESSLDIGMVIDALLESIAAGVSGFVGGQEGDTVWVVNLGTGASSRYINFPFNSFAQIGDRQYAAMQDGIYLLDGDTDSGEQIDSVIATGLQDLGSNELKRLGPVYLRGMSENVMELTVSTPDGQKHHYEARRADNFNRVQRFDIGKGLRASTFAFALSNVDGGDFNVSTLEVTPVKSNRRI